MCENYHYKLYPSTSAHIKITHVQIWQTRGPQYSAYSSVIRKHCVNSA